jgi:hypothetical protein
MLKGLSLKQYVKILEFIQECHAFGNYSTEEELNNLNKKYPNKLPNFKLSIKYIDNCYDTRTKTIWLITFRVGNHCVNFSTTHFSGIEDTPAGWKYDNLFDLCMDYLNGKFIPTPDFIKIL